MTERQRIELYRAGECFAVWVCIVALILIAGGWLS